jgi:hypothetical protein
MTDRQNFQRRIVRFAKARRHLLNATLGYGHLWLALLVGIATLLLLSGHLSSALLNVALFAVAGLCLLALAGVYLVRRVKRGSELDEAFVMEELAGGLNSRLISAWDFLKSDSPTPLAREVIQRAGQDLDFAYEAQLDRQERNRRRWKFAAALVAFVVLGLTPMFAFSRVVQNFQLAWADVYDLLYPVHYRLSPDAGQHVYRLGEKVNVRLQLNRSVPQAIVLVSQRGEEEPERIPLKLDEDDAATFDLTSEREAEYKLKFEFGERETDSLAMIFTTPPTLVNMETEIVPPGYTRLMPRTLEGIQQRLLGLPGTGMTLGFTFSKDLESATITWDDGEVLPLEVLGRFASIGFLHNRERRGVLTAKGIYGYAMDDPIDVQFDLQNDEKPRLFVPKHLKDDMPLLPENVASFGFGVRAQDDYGITRCTLVWQKSTVDNPTNTIDRGELERVISPAQPTVTVSFDKAFAGQTLQPGDKITFWVEATDNRAPKKLNQTTSSRRFSLFVFQEDLGGLTIKQLGFDKLNAGKGRIAKSRRATTVKSPEGLRNTEKVKNDFQGAVASSTRAPNVRGEFSQATREYFKLLSGVSYAGQQTEQPPSATGTIPEKPIDGQ